MKQVTASGARPRAPSQSDIAREAAVSTATVSRVLNNSDLVRPEVRARVEAAIERLNYLRHGPARALALNRSWTIGAVVPTLKNDIFARGIDALMNRLRELDYSLMVVSTEYSLTTESVLVRRLLEAGVDGLFLIGRTRLPETLAVLERAGRPFVETYITDGKGRDCCIGFSNAGAGAALVEHLLALGHRRIGMFAGYTRENDRARRRLEGVRAALAAHGLSLVEHATLELPYDIQASRDAFAALLRRPEPPTALICGNDILALGVLFEAATRGFTVPAEMSVVGFDDHPLCQHLAPALTTIDVPAAEMGERAAEALAAAIEQNRPIERLELPAPLLVRDSTARPRAA